MSIIDIKNLTKVYGSKAALSGVELHIKKGQIVGLMGPNGSGKTTLIKTLMGLLRADSGTVLIDGKALGVEMKVHIA